MKKVTSDESYQLRLELMDDIKHGRLSLPQAALAMRKSTGMTQPKFARFLHIAPRTLMDLETERGNPRLETLKKLGRPFGLEVGFIIKK